MQPISKLQSENRMLSLNSFTFYSLRKDGFLSYLWSNLPWLFNICTPNSNVLFAGPGMQDTLDLQAFAIPTHSPVHSSEITAITPGFPDLTHLPSWGIQIILCLAYRSTYNPARWLSIELCLLRCLWALRSGTEAINWQYATTQQQCQGYRGYSINARGRPCASTFPCPGRLPWPAPPPSRSTRLIHVNTVYQFALQKLFRNIKCALLGLSEFCKTI